MAEQPTIDRAVVERLARLACLSLRDDEAETLTRDLAGILDYVQELSELDTAAVPPTSHGTSLSSRLRPDVVEPGLSIELALGNAPEVLAQTFGVPKIVE